MDKLIEKIKDVMIGIATGEAAIQEKNKEYKRLYYKLDDLLTINGLKNPNDFSDLWEFYDYWTKQKMATYASRRSYVIGLYKNIKKLKRPNIKVGAYSYVNLTRIKELKLLKNKDFDITKLVRLCEELNISFSNECFLSVGMLVRAIIDHVPPIFKKATFTEVANNYGSKSFKASMKNLDNSSRKISDSCLHVQIRKKEVLPNSNQVDFSNDLDVLLAEIYRILK